MFLLKLGLPEENFFSGRPFHKKPKERERRNAYETQSMQGAAVSGAGGFAAAAHDGGRAGGLDHPRPESFEALGASGNYNPLKTPYHYDKTTGNIAYCLKHKKDLPSSSAEHTDFDASALWGQNTVTGIQAIVDHGCPNSCGGLSEEQAHYATANAIRAWMKESADVGDEFMLVDGQQRAVGVVAVVDGVRAVRLVRDPAVDVGVDRGHAVYSFRGAVAVRVVGEGQRAARLAHARQLAALRSGIRPLAVREQVADLIVLEAAAVVAGEQVAPAAAVGVAVGYLQHHVLSLSLEVHSSIKRKVECARLCLRIGTNVSFRLSIISVSPS